MHFIVADPHGVYPLTQVEVEIEAEHDSFTARNQARVKAAEQMMGCPLSECETQVATEFLDDLICTPATK